MSTGVLRWVVLFPFIIWGSPSGEMNDNNDNTCLHVTGPALIGLCATCLLSGEPRRRFLNHQCLRTSHASFFVESSYTIYITIHTYTHSYHQLMQMIDVLHTVYEQE